LQLFFPSLNFNTLLYLAASRVLDLLFLVINFIDERLFVYEGQEGNILDIRQKYNSYFCDEMRIWLPNASLFWGNPKIQLIT